MEFLLSFLRRHYVRKPVVASRDVGWLLSSSFAKDKKDITLKSHVDFDLFYVAHIDLLLCAVTLHFTLRPM